MTPENNTESKDCSRIFCSVCKLPIKISLIPVKYKLLYDIRLHCDHCHGTLTTLINSTN